MERPIFWGQALKRHCRLPISNFRFPISDFKAKNSHLLAFQIGNWQLAIGNRQSSSALVSADRRQPPLQTPGHGSLSLDRGAGANASLPWLEEFWSSALAR